MPRDHAFERVQRIGRQQRSQRGPADNDDFRWLYEHANGAVFHEEPANHRSQHHQYSDNGKHSLCDFLM